MRSIPQTQGLGRGLSLPDAFQGESEVLFSLDKTDTRCEGILLEFLCLSQLLPWWPIFPAFLLSHSWVQASRVFELFVPICLKNLRLQELHPCLSWPQQPHSPPSPTVALSQTSTSLGWPVSSRTSWNRTNGSTILLANPNWLSTTWCSGWPPNPSDSNWLLPSPLSFLSQRAQSKLLPYQTPFCSLNVLLPSSLHIHTSSFCLDLSLLWLVNSYSSFRTQFKYHLLFRTSLTPPGRLVPFSSGFLLSFALNVVTKSFLLHCIVIVAWREMLWLCYAAAKLPKTGYCQFFAISEDACISAYLLWIGFEMWTTVIHIFKALDACHKIVF